LAGAFFGFLLCYFIHLAAKLRRGLAATRKPEAKHDEDSISSKSLRRSEVAESSPRD
jgi:hypothetical protein